jgi:predicted glycogen debranching enzyme
VPPQDPVRRIELTGLFGEARRALLQREWLVTNGLGGYASGTLGGFATRRYHGVLIAALPAPLGRRLLLAHVGERVRLPGGAVATLTSPDLPEHAGHGAAAPHLTEFRLELGLPVWRYDVHGAVIEKRIVLPHEQNTVHVLYRLLEGAGSVRLKLRLIAHHRPHDAPVSTPLPEPIRVMESDQRFELAFADLPPWKFMVYGSRSAFTVERAQVPEVVYPVERARGYEPSGALWSPGYFRLDLTAEQPAALVASTETWETMLALAPQEAEQAERGRRLQLLAASPPAARSGLAAELVLAADQFLVKASGRGASAARLLAEGGEGRTVIAGYHWFTDWGRDTMISLEGLALATGRHAEAAGILRTFAHHIRDGLIPNLFAEGQQEGLYHTADATLWFFHAIDRYLAATGDQALLDALLPKLVDVVEQHWRGTRFGIGVDPSDALLRQGAEGYQLTWMDAKVGDWVVTPRRGKAVEINALWHNALCLLAGWLGERGRADDAERWSSAAATVRRSFNRRFWYAEGGYLYDVVDGEGGDDAALRPNQVMAISLPHAVLARERWGDVLRVVRQRLLTPFGLRTLAPGHPDYRDRYDGDIRARDAAYHQGTVWPWLVGPFVDAWLKAHPQERRTPRDLLAAFDRHLDEACVGSISEIFDAEPPFHARGCVAQAWSVAEVLRSLLQLAEGP